MALKYKAGDRVRIKDIDWYNKNKDSNGNVVFSSKVFHISWCENVRTVFTKDMSKFCGKVVTIEIVWTANYSIVEGTHRDYFTDEMIEGLVEEETKNNNDMEEKETLLGWVKESDSLRLVPHKDYEIKHDGNNFYLVKKKKEYPKTYKECLKILGFTTVYTPKIEPMFDYDDDIIALQKLKNCRDAYWQIAGEEMGLGKPWEPDWNDGELKWCMSYSGNYIEFDQYKSKHHILAFPTKGMRDAFYENFKELIESCKELL